jgi:type VI secretion system protein ImpI
MPAEPPPMPRATPPQPPMEPPPPPPPPRLPERPPPGAGSSDVFRRFAKGAGIEESAIAARDPGELAEQLGVLMRIVAGNIGQLLVARAESKGAMRSSSQTLIQASDNNPLRFTPSAEEALAIMFGRQTRSYLDARTSLEQSFAAIKSHQVDTFAAVQQAIQQLVAELDPKEIEKALDAAKGGSSLFANKKARLWDDYVMRWKMKAGRSETGLLGAFMLLFAEAYDKRRKP